MPHITHARGKLMNEQAKYKLKGFLMMFLSSTSMGCIGAFGRFINAPGDFVSFGRNLIGFLALTIGFFFIKGMWQKVKETKWSAGTVLTGITLGLLSGLYVISTQWTTLANASFLIYTGPIYSTILAAVILKEKISWKGFLCIAAVVIGMLFIVGIITPEGLTLDLDPKYMTGNAIALGSGVAYGLHLFFGRYRTDVDSNVRAWNNMGLGFITIFFLMIADYFVNGKQLLYTVKVDGVTQYTENGPVTAVWNIFEMPFESWMWWLAASFFAGAIAFYLLAFATKMLKAGELAAISYQETIMASVAGFFLFGEVLTTFQLIGGVLIVVGGIAQIFVSTSDAGKAGDLEEAVSEKIAAEAAKEGLK